MLYESQNVGFFRRHRDKLAVSLLITSGIIYTVHKGGLKLLPEGGDFDVIRARWWTLPVYILTLLAFNYFRSIRWRFLLRHFAEVPKQRLLTISFLGFAAILLMPLRIGEFVRPYMIRTPAGAQLRPGDKPITLATATSSVIAERVVDGFYLGSLILASALLFVPTIHPLPDTVVGIPVSVARARMSAYGVAAFFAVGVSTLAVFYFARAWAHRTTLAVVGKLSMSLAERLAGLCEKFADGLHVFGRGRDALGFFWETSLYWFINAAGMWLLAWGCGVVHADGSAPTLGEAFALMGMLGCTILIPGPPGLLGVFQLGIYTGMTMYYPTNVVLGPGAAYVFIMYASQVVVQLALGAAALFVESRGGGLRALEEEEALVGAPADAA
jgi:hypothetical protein